MRPPIRPIAALCAAAACFFPASIIRNAPISDAYALSATAGSAEALSIPDDSINVDISKMSSGHGGIFPVSGDMWDSKTGGLAVTNYRRGPKPAVELPWMSASKSMKLRKMSMFFTIQVPNKENTNSVDKIREAFSIRLKFRTEGLIDGGTTLNNRKFDISLNPLLSTSNTLTYNVRLPISVYGDTFQASIVFNYMGKDTLTEEKVTLSAIGMADDPGEYSMCSAKLPGGEGVYVTMNTDDITPEEQADFMRMLCRYVNSLADITNIHHDDIYIMFDEKYAECPCCDHAIMSYDFSTATVMMPVGYNEHCFKDTVKNRQLDWGLMHEISHCYAFTGYETEFAKAYNFSLDDVHTNIRAITSMQNCLQLRSNNIVKNGVDLGDYTTALINAQPEFDAEKGFYDVINAYGRYASGVQNGWNILEKLFSGEYESPYLTNDVVYSALDTINSSENYRYGFDDGEHTQILFKSADTYRFINSMYYLCKNAGNANYRFNSFICDYMGADEFAGFINEKTNFSELGEANISHLSGDVNLDRTTDISDQERLTGYMNNTQGLSPEGAFNADFDKNGYIDQNDFMSLSAE
ncbi:MAG: hypothetical protein IJK31_04655 [Ruminococcus sp.]|nr:hypothetical protein [Ruminococcus sp.]